MQFFAFFAAAVATFTTAADAAPGNYGNGGDNSIQNVRVRFSLDLNPNTPISSRSCAAIFAKKFPRESPRFHLLCDGLLISYPDPTEFHTLCDLPTAPFYGEIPGAVDGSPQCGSCWQLQYSGQAPVYMIAVDNAAMFQLSKPAFDKFAGAEGAAKGSVNATAVQVSPGACNLW